MTTGSPKQSLPSQLTSPDGDADPEPEAVVAALGGPLHVDGGVDGVRRRLERGHDPVARRLEDPARRAARPLASEPALVVDEQLVGGRLADLGPQLGRPSTSVNRIVAVDVAIVRSDYRAFGRRGACARGTKARSGHDGVAAIGVRWPLSRSREGTDMPLYVIERNFAEEIDPSTTSTTRASSSSTTTWACGGCTRSCRLTRRRRTASTKRRTPRRFVEAAAQRGAGRRDHRGRPIHTKRVTRRPPHADRLASSHQGGNPHGQDVCSARPVDRRDARPVRRAGPGLRPRQHVLQRGLRGARRERLHQARHARGVRRLRPRASTSTRSWPPSSATSPRRRRWRSTCTSTGPASPPTC